MKQFKEEFVDECIKNRVFLELSYKDVSSCLINVSEENYKSFEEGKFSLSKENIERLIRVLCIKKPCNIDVNKCIDTTDLNEDEIKDLSMVVEAIVGDDNA